MDDMKGKNDDKRVAGKNLYGGEGTAPSLLNEVPGVCGQAGSRKT
jgi:hypothetical protein